MAWIFPQSHFPNEAVVDDDGDDYCYYYCCDDAAAVDDVKYSWALQHLQYQGLILWMWRMRYCFLENHGEILEK